MDIIKGAKDLVDSAVRQIKRYQTKEDSPIVTRYGHFNENCIGGIFKGMIITIAGISGSGKTYLLQELEEDMFNKKLNPNCDDYVLLRCNWETSVFKLLLRKLKRTLSVTMKTILFTETNKEDAKQFKEVCDSERANQIFYLETPTDPKTWYEAVKTFLELNKEKKHVLVSVDHIALVRDLFGGKKKAMDELVEFTNSLKKEFNNVSFILISQLNRDIESRESPKEMPPRRSDLYNSDTMFHISDIVLVLHNPYRLGHDRYMVIPGLGKDKTTGKIINPRYRYLREWMQRPEQAKTSFITKNVLFFHYLKIREIEDMEDIKDIYIEPLISAKPTLKSIVEEEEQMEEKDVYNPKDGLDPKSTSLESLETKHNKDDDSFPF